MKEEILHYLWKKKKIPCLNLKLITGENLSIIKFGEYNEFESGPDFINAEIEIEGVRWFGNIEIHVKSSDWYLHNHQNDKSFENVILHVVLKFDKDVYINGVKLPTLQLVDIINEASISDYFKYSHQFFNCAKSIQEIDGIYLESMKSRVLINRLDRKVKSLSYHIDPAQNLFILLARAFGNKVNAETFEEIPTRIPIQILKKESAKIKLANLIKGVSGMESSGEWEFIKIKYNIEEIPIHLWKRKGLRPSSFPEKRILQFADIVSKFNFETIFLYFNEIELLDYFYNLLESSLDSNKLVKSFKDLIIINCFVPFIWWYGSVTEKDELKEKAISLLSSLKPENNRIIKKWSELGVKVINSYDSQALLEIYNQFCTFRKCLHCDVGCKILNK